MTNATIRRATAADVPQLAATIRAAYAIYNDRDIALPPVWDGLDQAVSETPVFIAESGADLLGAIVLRVRQDALQIENLAVRPEAAGRGIGRALLDRAEILAHELGQTTLLLATHRDLSENIALYHHLGWTITEQLGTKVKMQKTLSAI